MYTFTYKMTTLHQAVKKRKKKIRITALRSFFGSPQKRGVVVKVRLKSPKKPNSAKRKIARIKLTNRYMVTTKIKGQGHNLQKFSEVLVCGGRANDLPGVRYNMIRGKYGFSWRENFNRYRKRSKYGIRRDDVLHYNE